MASPDPERQHDGEQPRHVARCADASAHPPHDYDQQPPHTDQAAPGPLRYCPGRT